MRQVAHTAARQNQKRWSRTTTPAKQFIERLQRSLPFDTSAPQSTTLMTLFDRDFRGGDGIHAEKGPAILPNHAKKGPMRMVWGGLGIFPTSCRTSQHRADPRRYVWGEWAIFPAFHHETRVCQTQHTLHGRSPNPTTMTKRQIGNAVVCTPLPSRNTREPCHAGTTPRILSSPNLHVPGPCGARDRPLTSPNPSTAHHRHSPARVHAWKYITGPSKRSPIRKKRKNAQHCQNTPATGQLIEQPSAFTAAMYTDDLSVYHGPIKLYIITIPECICSISLLAWRSTPSVSSDLGDPHLLVTWSRTCSIKRPHTMLSGSPQIHWKTLAASAICVGRIGYLSHILPGDDETRVCQTQHTLHSRSPNPTTLTKWSSAPTRHGGSACTRVSDSRCQDAMSLFSKPAVTVSVYGTAV